MSSKAPTAHCEAEPYLPEPDTLRNAPSALDVDAKRLFKLFGAKAKQIMANALDEEQIAAELSAILLFMRTIKPRPTKLPS